MDHVYALIDCENFYASCERVFDPSLRGKPVAVVLYLHAGNPTPTSTPHAPEPNGYGRVACPLHRFQGVVHELFHDVAAPVVGRLPG